MSKVSFNTKHSPFFDALREKVDNYFASNNIKVTGNYKLYLKTILLLSSVVVLYSVLVFFTPPVWISIVLCCLLGLNFAAIGFNVMHDGAHGSYSNNKTLNDVMAYSLNALGGSSYIWKIKHNIIHHSFTNIEGVDDDINIGPWMRVSDSQPKYWFHKFQHLYWIILYGVSYFLWVYYLDFNKYFKGQIADTKLRKWALKEHFIFWGSKLAYTILFIGLPIYSVGVLATIIGYAVVVFVCGVTISTVFQLAHVVEDTDFPQVDIANKIDQEWAIHQVATTANFATKSKLVSWFVGGLNFQVEHHLFPRISHIHYPQISKLVKETCIKFNVPYLEYPTVYHAVRSHVLHLRNLGVR